VNRKGLSIVDLIIIIVYIIIIGIPLFLLFNYLLNLIPQPSFNVWRRFVLETCLGSVILSVIAYACVPLVLWLVKPLGQFVAPTTHAKTYAKMKKVLPPIIAIAMFVIFGGMNNCGIWHILGIEGFMQTFYVIVIILCLAFLGSLFMHE
jgi:hypothetical protein